MIVPRSAKDVLYEDEADLLQCESCATTCAMTTEWAFAVSSGTDMSTTSAEALLAVAIAAAAVSAAMNNQRTCRLISNASRVFSRPDGVGCRAHHQSAIAHSTVLLHLTVSRVLPTLLCQLPVRSVA